MKVCTRCKIPKDESDYNNKREGVKKSMCRSCQNEYSKKHYTENKEYYYDKRKKFKTSTIELCDNYKRQLNCGHCNLSFKDEPYLCDFHHVNNDKEFDLASKRSTSFKKFLEEAEKCIALCPICHRREHYRLKQV